MYLSFITFIYHWSHFIYHLSHVFIIYHIYLSFITFYLSFITCIYHLSHLFIIYHIYCWSFKLFYSLTGQRMSQKNSTLYFINCKFILVFYRDLYILCIYIVPCSLKVCQINVIIIYLSAIWENLFYCLKKLLRSIAVSMPPNYLLRFINFDHYFFCAKSEKNFNLRVNFGF